MDRPWLAAAGIALVWIVLVDVAWTTIAVAGGRGPVTNMVAHSLWSTVRGARSHRVLHLAGVLILVTVLVTWVLAMLAGWALLFNADDASVVDSSSQAPAGAVAKVAYAAGALAGAGAGYTATTGGWQLANNIAALGGLALFTLAISYLLQVVSAATQKRATAVHISGLGAGPAEIVAAGAGQPSLGAVGNQVTSLTTQLALIARQHLALPVLHYLHVGDRDAAIELAVARLDEALTIIECGLPGEHGPVVGPARTAIDEYLKTTRIPDTGEGAPPPPDLAALTDRDVDIDTDRLEHHIAAASRRRSRLRALVEVNGWDWESDVTRH